MMKKRGDAVRIIKAVRKKAQHRRVAMPWLRLSLQFVDARHKALLPRYQVARWLRHALDAEKVKGAELTVRIVGLDEGHMLNHEYRHKDYATNVLTFDYAQAPMVAADLVICAPVVEREAREQGKAVNAHYAHLLVHGALHAQGWDHERDDEARAMEQRETEVLARLGFGNPY